jgi:transcriptional regulator of acetoin/glycerol metabolism
VCAIAAPVLDEDGTPLAALAISMPDSQFDAARLPELGRFVADAAEEIAARRRGAYDEHAGARCCTGVRGAAPPQTPCAPVEEMVTH